MPLVSIITPVTLDREQMLYNCIKSFNAQDYINKEHIIIYDELMSIGNKRNKGCNISTGNIIIHFDSDDYYAPDWITKSVEALINSKADCVGLSSGYFFKIPYKVIRYDYPKGCQPYVLGATMCYWRKTWERNPFQDTNRGEDTLFCANAGKVVAHDHINGFMAMLHGGNTSSHLQIDKKEFTPQDISIAKNILGTDFEKYVSLLCKSS